MQGENEAKLRRIFIEVLEIEPAAYCDELHQDGVENWDSMGMVSLIVAIEAAFEIEVDLLEFSRFVSVGATKDVLREHGIPFD